MFSSPKLRYVSSYALLPCVTAFTMRLGFLSAIDRTAEAIMSAVFTIVVLLVMQEITAKIRIKKIMLMYASEVHDYFMCQTEIKHKDSCTCTNRENLRLFAIKAINVVNKQEYILKSNVKYAKNASTLLMSLHHLSRTPNFVKNIKNSSEYDSLIKYFDSLFCKLVDDLKRSREIKLNISKKLVTKFSNNDAVTLNGFYNQYAVKGIINDFQQINGFNLE